MVTRISCKELNLQREVAYLNAYHCEDCLNWQVDKNGGGRCKYKKGNVWPGNTICDRFEQ